MYILALGSTVMGGLGLAMAIFLAVANRKFHVEEDPRIDLVEGALPATNCGGCGQPGCRAFAEGVVKGEMKTTGCPVGGEGVASSLATIMGVDAAGFERKVAKVLCRGGLRETKRDSTYYGVAKCSTANMVGGGEKACKFSCIGYGDCVEVCKFDAMWMNHNGLPVVDENACTGCNKCVEACPRDIIELHSPDVKVHVYCKSKDIQKVAKQVCTVACIGCGLCAKADPDNIFMEDNLAIIRYGDGEYIGDKESTKKCPTDSIIFELDPIHD